MASKTPQKVTFELGGDDKSMAGSPKHQDKNEPIRDTEKGLRKQKGAFGGSTNLAALGRELEKK